MEAYLSMRSTVMRPSVTKGKSMTDKELSRLRRTELLELLIAQGKENVALQKKLEEAERAAQNREMTIREAGSMADAAVEINDLIGTAQRSVDLYTENVYRVCREQEARAEQLVSEAQAYAEKLVAEAQTNAGKMLADAEERVDMLMDGARESALTILHDAQAEAKRIITEAESHAARLQREAEQDAALCCGQADCEDEYETDAVPEGEQRRGFWKRRKA